MSDASSHPKTLGAVMSKEKAESTQVGQLTETEMLVGAEKDEENGGHSLETGENGLTLQALRNIQLLCNASRQSLNVMVDTQVSAQSIRI